MCGFSSECCLFHISAAPDFGDFAGFQNTSQPPPQVQAMPAAPASVQPQSDFGAFQGLPSVTPQAPVSAAHTYTHTHTQNG